MATNVIGVRSACITSGRRMPTNNIYSNAPPSHQSANSSVSTKNGSGSRCVHRQVNQSVNGKTNDHRNNSRKRPHRSGPPSPASHLRRHPAPFTSSTFTSSSSSHSHSSSHPTDTQAPLPILSTVFHASSPSPAPLSQAPDTRRHRLDSTSLPSHQSKFLTPFPSSSMPSPIPAPHSHSFRTRIDSLDSSLSPSSDLVSHHHHRLRILSDSD